MRDEVFEYRPTRARETARTWVRELLAFFVLTASLIFFTDYYRHPVEYRYFEETFIMAVVLGVPISCAFWAVYRVLRFALNR